MMQTSDLYNELPATPVRVDGTTAVELNGVYWRKPGVVLSKEQDIVMVVQMPYSYQHMINVMTMVDPEAGKRGWAMGGSETLPIQSNHMPYFAWFDAWDGDARRMMMVLGLHGVYKRYIDQNGGIPQRNSFSSAARHLLYSDSLLGAYLAYQFMWNDFDNMFGYRIVPSSSIPGPWLASLPYPLSNHLFDGVSARFDVSFFSSYGSLLADTGGTGDFQFGQFYCNPAGVPVWEVPHYTGWQAVSGGYTYYTAPAHGARVVHAEMVDRGEWPF